LVLTTRPELVSTPKLAEPEGFAVYEYEWWHFDYRDWKSYAIQNMRFEAIGANK
jgi:D-alanyl-D-alanine dipeptidase